MTRHTGITVHRRRRVELTTRDGCDNATERSYDKGGGMQITITAADWGVVCVQDGLLEEICLRLADGETLKELAEAWGVPCGRVQAWVMADEARYEAYSRALEVHAHTLMAEVVKIADEGECLGRDKLRIETRFRVAAAHAKARYGVEAGAGRTTVQVVVNRGGLPAPGWQAGDPS